MALNQFMHPRNRYKDSKPDFAALALKYPEFERHLCTSLSGKVSLDFRDPEALRSLTCTLLKEDFGIDLEIPLDRIIPTVPLRLNYILWIEDLLKQSGHLGESTDIYGIDVGCGASCIYPLLGAKMNGWHFTTSEVDSTAAGFATLNVKRNNLQNHIQVLEARPDDMLCGITKAVPRSLYHFTMCNPPFFGNILEAQGIMNSRSIDRSEPSSVSTAAEGEMIWQEGGEVDFIRRMITDSLQLREQVVWYTSMIGKKASVAPIKQELARHKIRNVTTTEFCQGRTMRWGIGWTFHQDVDLPVSPSTKRFKRNKERPPLVVQVPERAVQSALQEAACGSEVKSGGTEDQRKVKAIAKVLEKLMKSLEIEVKPKPGTKQCVRYALTAVRNTWSNQRRKRRQMLRSLSPKEDSEPTTEVAGSGEDVKEKSLEDAGIVLTAKHEATSESQGMMFSGQDITGGNGSKGKAGGQASSDSHSFSDEPGTTCSVPNSDEGNGIRTSPGKLTESPRQTDCRAAETVKEMTVEAGDSSDPIPDARDQGDSSGELAGTEDAVSSLNPGCSQELKECHSTDSSDDATASTGQPHPPGGSKQADNFQFKCMLIVKMVEGKVVVEMRWTEGRTRESMHQVGQYIKNQLSKM